MFIGICYDLSRLSPTAPHTHGPGPSDVPPRILEALGRPTIGHLDPRFIDLMDEVKTLLQYVMQTENALTMPISAPGSAGMEACFVNLVQPGDKVIVCQNGVFGGRMKENVERCGATPIMVQDAWGSAVDPQKLEDALIAIPMPIWSPSCTPRPRPGHNPMPDPGRAGPQTRLPDHRRRRHLARGHAR